MSQSPFESGTAPPAAANAAVENPVDDAAETRPVPPVGPVTPFFP